MKARHLILTAAAVAGAMALVGGARASILINEIRIDQPGNDNDEFVEFFSTLGGGESFAGLHYLVLGDGAGGSGTIEAVVDLGGQAFGAARPYFVIAEGTFTLGAADFTTNLNFENSDNVTHMLVSGFSGADGQDLDTDDDGILDVTPWTSIVDGVGLVRELNPPTVTEFDYSASLGLPGVGPDGTFVPGTVMRAPDGGDWVIGNFDHTSTTGNFNTPGVANIPEPSAVVLLAGSVFALALRRRRIAG